MLKKVLAVSVLAALSAAAQASDYVVAGDKTLRTSAGECIRTGYWTPSSEECDPKPKGMVFEEKKQALELSAEILFDFDSAFLTEEARERIDELVGRGEIERVYAAAHADRIGGSHYNVLLSERRLDALRSYLMEKGVPDTKLVLEAKGDREPLTAGRCDGLGPESRRNSNLVACLQPDRRVEIEVRGTVLTPGPAALQNADRGHQPN